LVYLQFALLCTANGKLVSEDKDFEKQIEEEIGLPDF